MISGGSGAKVGRSSRPARPLLVSQLHCLQNSSDMTQTTSSWASTLTKHPDNRGVIYAVIRTALESTRTHIHHIPRGRTFDGALPFIHQSFSSVKTLEPITAFTLSFLANHSQDSRFTMATHVINTQRLLDTCSVGMLSHYCVRQGCQTPPPTSVWSMQKVQSSDTMVRSAHLSYFTVSP